MTQDLGRTDGATAVRPDEHPEHVAAIRAVETEFGELVFRFRRIVHENAERLAPGLSPGAYKVFAAIVRHGPVTSAQVAERTLLDKGQLSRTVRELEDHGLVARTPDPQDRRASLLEATPDGVRRFESSRRPHEQLLFETLLSWDPERVRDLAGLLHALTQGITPPEG